MASDSIPGYTLKKKLGEGAMASVFLAEDNKLHREVALKVMSKKLLSDTSFADRFLREARIVASISHRNIVTVFDVGSHNNHHYMAMELLPGGDMSAKLQQELPLKEGISYVIDIAEGLQYAGSKKFIHRDIKPDNIMFAEDGRAVITDFGIARDASAESEMTMVGSVIGTPQYMSPEQAAAKELDHRTDLYSLGIILYQIIAGRTPFKGDSAISTGVMHINDIVPALPMRYEQFQEFIDIALAKDPDDRFQSGHAFIEALSKISVEEKEENADETMIFSADDIASAVAEQEQSKKQPEETIDFLSDLSDAFLEEAEVSKNESLSLETELNTPTDEAALDDEDGSEPPTLEDKPAATSSKDTPTLTPSSAKKKEKKSFATEESRSFSLVRPKGFLLLFILIIGMVGGHIYYVNVLGKQVQFTGIASHLTNFSHKNFGKSPNFFKGAETLNSVSYRFGKFSEKVLGDVLPTKKAPSYRGIDNTGF